MVLKMAFNGNSYQANFSSSNLLIPCGLLRRGLLSRFVFYDRNPFIQLL